MECQSRWLGTLGLIYLVVTQMDNVVILVPCNPSKGKPTSTLVCKFMDHVWLVAKCSASLARLRA